MCICVKVQWQCAFDKLDLGFRCLYRPNMLICGESEETHDTPMGAYEKAESLMEGDVVEHQG